MPSYSVELSSLLLAVGVGCSAAPPSEGSSSSDDLASSGASILVPATSAEPDLVAACAPELGATYCSASDADAAMARCEARLNPSVAAACDGRCLTTYAAHRIGCFAGKTYPTPASCASPVVDDCAFYRACLEPARPCGVDGYALPFGERLCFAFVDERRHFSRAGQAWLRGIRTCLQTALVPLMTEALTCDALTDAAYASHAPCYTAPGNSICSLPALDVIELVRILGVTLVSSRGLAQIREIARACLLGGLGLSTPAFFEALARAAETDESLRAFVSTAAARDFD